MAPKHESWAYSSPVCSPLQTLLSLEMYVTHPGPYIDQKIIVKMIK